MRCVLQISSRSHQATAIAWQHKQHEKEMTRMSLNGKAKWHQCRVPFSGRGFPSLVCLTASGSAIQHRGHSLALLEESISEQMWYRRANIFFALPAPPCGLVLLPAIPVNSRWSAMTILATFLALLSGERTQHSDVWLAVHVTRAFMAQALHTGHFLKQIRAHIL